MSSLIQPRGRQEVDVVCNMLECYYQMMTNSLLMRFRLYCIKTLTRRYIQ